MLAILADDLTGAIDSAAPFAGRGLHVEVALDLDAIDTCLAAAPIVVAINVRTRELPANQARQATAKALERLPAGTRLFKKVDSRLKGNIAAELDVTPFDSALMAPAIPDFGRFVADGRVSGFGMETALPVSEVIGRHVSRMHIPDTATNEDMVAALGQAQADGCDLLIGARGLADALARQMTDDGKLKLTPVDARPLLIVVGSRDPITICQVDRLRSAMHIRYLSAPGGTLAAASGEEQETITLVQATEGEVPVDALQMSDNLAGSVVPAFSSAAHGLMLTGGATAEAVLARMGVNRFRLLGECLPGLGLAFHEGRYIITKSGGFGHPETLCDIARQVMDRAA